MCKYNICDILSLFLVLVSMRVCNTVKIKELRVPEVARHGTSVVLDCDYTLEDSVDHNGLVVKWYFNDQSRPVYQWIPGSMKPQGLGVLRDKLNLEYMASKDARTMHRALHILEPSADLSGEYTCVVSTFQTEDKKTKNMLVFVPEKNLRLQQHRSPDGTPKVVCSAEGLFPQPEMSIRMDQDNVSRELEGSTVMRKEREDGLYDISVVAPLPDEVVRMSADFACELRIPKANYTVQKKFVYYPGNASSNDSGYTWMVITAYGVVKYILKF